MGDTTKRAQITPMAVSMKIKSLSAGLMFLGLLVFVILMMKNQERAWHAYLTAYMYFFILAIGGLFFTAIQHVTSAGWSVNVRRICEAFTAFLPFAFVFGIILFFGGSHLYEWFTTSKVMENPLLAHKSAYLNITFFAVRTVLFFGLWIWFAKKIVGFSTKQDETGDESLTLRALPWSIAFLGVFALSFSLYTVDVIMSLQADWFSTIFGIYCFSGMFQATMATMILIVVYMRKRGLLAGYVDDNHLHDLGKFMFAFTVFWAYIAYSQYMLIWYANLPEETTFFLTRTTGAWTKMSIILLLFKFVVPFLLLLPKWAKRSEAHLTVVSILILVMQYVDLHWLIYPNLNGDEVVLGLPEIAIFGGFAGVFMFSTFRFFSKHAIVPIRDPRIQESIHHHVVY